MRMKYVCTAGSADLDYSILPRSLRLPVCPCSIMSTIHVVVGPLAQINTVLRGVECNQIQGKELERLPLDFVDTLTNYVYSTGGAKISMNLWIVFGLVVC